MTLPITRLWRLTASAFALMSSLPAHYTFGLLSAVTIGKGHQFHSHATTPHGFPLNRGIQSARFQDGVIATFLSNKRNNISSPSSSNRKQYRNGGLLLLPPTSLGVKLRGGGDSDEDEDESKRERNNEHTPESKKIDDVFIRVDAELVPGGTANAKRHNIGSSFNLPSILWLSVAFDAILNKKKRALLFPVAGDAAAATNPVLRHLGPTGALASGYFLSSGLFFLLSTNYFTEESVDAAYRDGVFKNVTLLLALFGAVNLVGHCFSSPSQQFLGTGAALIHGHNVLVAVNGWIKAVTTFNEKKSVGEEIKSLAGGIFGSLFSFGGSSSGGGDVALSPSSSLSRRVVSSTGYAVVGFSTAVIALLKIVAIVAPTSAIAAVLTPDGILSKPLYWASISRLVLVSGLAMIMRGASERDFLSDVFFRLLNGALAVCSLAVTVSLAIPKKLAMISSSTTGTISSPYFAMDIVSLVSFSVFTAYNYFVLGRRQSKSNPVYTR